MSALLTVVMTRAAPRVHQVAIRYCGFVERSTKAFTNL